MQVQWRTISRGLLLITLGLIFLLLNLGLLPWSFWWEFASWWPLILVLLGIGLLLGRRLPGSFILFLILAFLLVLSLTGLGNALRASGWGPTHFGAPWGWGGWGSRSSASPPLRTTVSQPLPDGAKSAEVTLETGGVALTLDGGSAGLVDADLGYWGDAPEVSTDRIGDKAEVHIRQARTVDVWPGRPAPRWAVHLTNQVPLDLRIRAGAIKGDMDLSQVKLDRLDLKAGAGDLTVTLGRVEARVPIALDIAASHMTLRVPEGVPMRVFAKNVLGGLKGLSGLTPSSDGTYSTSDFSTASRGLDVAVHGAVSDIRLERY